MPSHAVYSAAFGGIEIRFIHIPEHRTVYVCREDLLAAVKSCLFGMNDSAADRLLREGLEFFADAEDKTGALIEVDTIGPALNAHAAGNFLHAMTELRDTANAALCESAFRVHALFLWYCEAFSQANRHFGFSLNEMLAMVAKRLDRLNPPFIVRVSVHNGLWTAECDALGLVTEADNYETLVERAWEIAPELAELNAVGVDAEKLRLRFSHETTASCAV